MASRLQFQSLLESILGSNQVYFQPPASFQLSYPCILYNRSNIRVRHGDNQPYIRTNQYTITVIDANPDSAIPNKISALPRCVFDRNFISDNLIHDTFNILY